MTLYWTTHGLELIETPGRRRCLHTISLVVSDDVTAAERALGVDQGRAWQCHTPEYVAAAGGRPRGEAWTIRIDRAPSVYDQFPIGEGRYDAMNQAGYDVS